jgi:exosortase
MATTGAGAKPLLEPLSASGADRPLRYWRPALLSLSILALFWSVIVALVGDWFKNPDYSHGFFVPFFSAYLVWKKREELRQLAPKPSWWGIVMVFASLGLLFLGSLGAELFLTRVGLVGTIVGCVIFFRGFPTLRTLVFPLTFLFLMIPLPAIIYNEIVFPLQLVASRFATACLQQSHVFPVMREGNLLILPNYTLEVVEACSGIRSLMSLTALALAYGYLAERSRWVRFLLVLLVLPIAIFSNGLRVMLAAMVTYQWGPEVGEGLLHSLYGIMIFLVATFLIIGTHAIINAGRRAWKRRASVGAAI